MVDVSKITVADIAKAVQENDIDEALRVIQTAIGQNDGDVAGIHFSGDQNIDINWMVYNEYGRIQVIVDYLKAEERSVKC